MRLKLSMVLMSLSATLAGCNEISTVEVNTASFQRQQLGGVSYRVAFNAATEALGEHFRVASRDYDEGIIRAAPAESFVEMDDPPRIGNMFGTGRRARRIAEVHVRASGPDVEVFCKVLIQHDQSAAVGVMHRAHGVEDQPTETPIDRDAGTTRSQNTVWSKGRRDRTLERQILTAIREKLQAAADDT